LFVPLLQAKLSLKRLPLKIGTMSRKVAIAITLVLLTLVGGYFFVKNARTRASVTTTLRITVTPSEQLDFVASQAKSAVFKYLLSKASGVPPALARNLEVKTVPNSSLLEAKVVVVTRDEGQRLAKAFVEALQGLCGKQVQLTLAEQSVK